MRCKKTDGSYVTTTWAYYYPQCDRISQTLFTCSARRGAYVPASIVCLLNR